MQVTSTVPAVIDGSGQFLVDRGRELATSAIREQVNASGSRGMIA
jgi:hypothetical protein